MDVQKSKMQGVYVNILQKNKKDISALLCFGVIALTYGFSVYYLLPLSLVSFNSSLAMTIFLYILFGMIAAMGLLSLNVQGFVNLVVLKIVLFWESQSTRLLVMKNLIAHKDRNKITSLMFSLTLGFIIFLSIVCRIPFSKDLAEFQKESGIRSINIEKLNLPIAEIEELMKKYEYAFEAWGVSTNQMYNK